MALVFDFRTGQLRDAEELKQELAKGIAPPTPPQVTGAMARAIQERQAVAPPTIGMGTLRAAQPPVPAPHTPTPAVSPQQGLWGSPPQGVNILEVLRNFRIPGIPTFREADLAKVGALAALMQTGQQMGITPPERYAKTLGEAQQVGEMIAAYPKVSALGSVIAPLAGSIAPQITSRLLPMTGTPQELVLRRLLGGALSGAGTIGALSGVEAATAGKPIEEVLGKAWESAKFGALAGIVVQAVPLAESAVLKGKEGLLKELGMQQIGKDVWVYLDPQLNRLTVYYGPKVGSAKQAENVLRQAITSGEVGVQPPPAAEEPMRGAIVPVRPAVAPPAPAAPPSPPIPLGPPEAVTPAEAVKAKTPATPETYAVGDTVYWLGPAGKGRQAVVKAVDEARRALTIETVDGEVAEVGIGKFLTKEKPSEKPTRPVAPERYEEKESDLISAEIERAMLTIPESSIRDRLERTGVARVGNVTAKIVQHPSGEGLAVEITREGDRQILDRPPMTLEEARNAAVEELLRPTPAPVEVREIPIAVSKDDIPLDLAIRAHRGMSFTPETRAEQVRDEYVSHMRSLYEELAPLAETAEQREHLIGELEKYREGYLKRLKAVLEARSRTLSPMITGRANFPTARNQKALDREAKLIEEMRTWQEKAVRTIKSGLGVSRVISGDDPEAVQKIKAKIADLEKRQEMMKAVNQIVRDKKLTDDEKIAKIVAETGLKESTARKILEPDETGHIGFADYALKNNNAEIRRLKVRLEELERRMADQTIETVFEGGRIVDNVEDNRVQIFFDAKPDEAVRGQLKARGFKWAPSVGAWQRQRSPEAMRVARQLTGAIDKPAEAPPPVAPASVVETTRPMVAAETVAPAVSPKDIAERIQGGVYLASGPFTRMNLGDEIVTAVEAVAKKAKKAKTPEQIQLLASEITGIAQAIEKTGDTKLATYFSDIARDIQLLKGPMPVSREEMRLVKTGKHLRSKPRALVEEKTFVREVKPEPEKPAHVTPKRKATAKAAKETPEVERAKPEPTKATVTPTVKAWAKTSKLPAFETSQRPIDLHKLVLSKHSIIPILNEVAVSDGIMMSTDGTVAVLTPTDLPDSMYKVLGTKRANLTFEKSDLPLEEFPAPRLAEGKIAKVTFDAKDIVPALKRALQNVSTEENRPSITGVALQFGEGKLAVASTDGVQLTLTTVPVPKDIPKAEVIVPAKAINLLLKDKKTPQVSIAVDEGVVTFDTGNAVITALPIEGKFPDYSKIIPEKIEGVAAIPATDLKNALEQLEPYVPKVAPSHVSIAPSPRGYVLKAKDPEREVKKEVEVPARMLGGGDLVGKERVELLLPVKIVGDAPKDEFSVNLKRLQKIVKYIEGDTLYLGWTDAQNKPFVLRETPLTEPEEAPKPRAKKPVSTADIEAKMSEEIHEAAGPVEVPIGQSIRIVKDEKAKHFAFSNDEIEARYQRAHGIRRESVLARVREIADSIYRRATREYEWLPRTKEFAQLRFDLKKLEKQKDVANHRTVVFLQGITLKLKDPAVFNLFERKVLLNDLEQEAKAGHNLPLGFTEETLKKEVSRLNAEIAKYPEIEEALNSRREVWGAVKNDYLKAMKDIGVNLDKRFTREDYFRHQVLEYANAKGLWGTGKKLKTPLGRGFLKAREGSALDINTHYLQTEWEVMAQMMYDTEIARTIKAVEDNYSITKEIKAKYIKALEELLVKLDGPGAIERLKYGMEKNKIPKVAYENTLKSKIEELEEGTLKKAGLEDWRNLVPEDYTIWQPREGNVFYIANAIPDQIAEEIMANQLSQVVTPEDVKKIFALGGRFREFVVKEEVAKTLDNLVVQRQLDPFRRAMKAVMRGWKQYQLISPLRHPRYQIRNMTGDADAVFVGNPSAFRKTKQATWELGRLYFGSGVMTDEMREWYKRGGMQSNLQVQEMGDLDQLKMFYNMLERKGTIVDIPMKVWEKYWKTARLTTDFRESILRYAAYLDYLEQMQKSPDGLPKNYGASIPEEIQGLKNIRDRAYKLSNELLGAYDSVSVLGQELREYLFPFWSWKEINFKRYIQFVRNATYTGDTQELIERSLKTAFRRSPLIAWRIAKLFIKAAALWGILQAWNRSRFPEEEEELPREVQRRPHIILGRDEDGKIKYFNRLGALGDLLEWFGNDAPHYLILDYLNGKKTIAECAEEMAKGPVNVLWQALGPQYKILAELPAGIKTYPDVFKPGRIRDKGLYLAEQFGLGDEYRRIAGLPVRRRNLASRVLYYTVDAGEGAYYDILDLKNDYMRKIGKSTGYSTESPRSNALYNIRLAIRYDDKRALEKYLIEYVLAGGTAQGLNQSLKNMHPLYGLSTKKGEVADFINTLDSSEKAKLLRAMQFYNEVLLSKPEETEEK